MSVTSEQPILNGLVLAGGQSRRMGIDKAGLRYGDDPRPQWKRMAELLDNVCTEVFVSIRQGQALDGVDPSDGFRVLEDPPESQGPLTGFLEAFKAAPQSAWLVVACDLPLLDRPTLEYLVAHRGHGSAVAYRSAHDGLPEPMCALYEPDMGPIFKTALENGMRCPRKILINLNDQVRLLDLPNSSALENANTPEEFERLSRLLKGVPS
jgi:molybdopterin-guanine dinucleotide biosynthesis protein A